MTSLTTTPTLILLLCLDAVRSYVTFAPILFTDVMTWVARQPGEIWASMECCPIQGAGHQRASTARNELVLALESVPSSPRR